MEIKKAWEFGTDQEYRTGGKIYNVNAALTLAADIEVKELAIDDLYISYSSPCQDNLRSFIEHMKMVNDADLDYPILINQDGVIIDGRHRLSKAILNGDKTIKAKRFIKDPASCYTWQS